MGDFAAPESELSDLPRIYRPGLQGLQRLRRAASRCCLATFGRVALLHQRGAVAKAQTSFSRYNSSSGKASRKSGSSPSRPASLIPMTKEEIMRSLLVFVLL